MVAKFMVWENKLRKIVILSKMSTKGQALIELILAIAVMVVVLSSLAYGFIASREAFARSDQNLQANLLLDKEIEAIRSVKAASWNQIASPGTYHTEQSSFSWVVANGSIEENGFTRSFEVKNVCRMSTSSAPISSSTPSVQTDPSTKEVTVTISWSFLVPRSISSTFYLSRYFGNDSWKQTTQADFSSGTHTNTVSTPAGEVRLEASTGGDWANPQVIGTEDLPGTQNANDIFVDGSIAYIVTAGGSGPELYTYDVSDPTNPNPLGSLDIGGAGFAIVVADGYAYIANFNNNRELTIVDVSNPSTPQLAGLFNAPTGANGRGVAVSGNTAYLVTDNNTTSPGYEFYSINVANKSAPTQLGGTNLNAAARDLFTIGNFAYIASTHNSQELQVVNITNPLAPSFVTSRDSTGNSDGQSIYALGNNLFMTDARLNIFDITNPASPQLTTSPNFPGSQRAVFALGNFIFLASTHNGSQFKVAEKANPSTEFGSADLGGNGFGVFVLGDYAFLVSANDTAEFQIVRGGVPGNPYQPSGVFESQTFDAGSTVAFNFFAVTFSEPAPTDIKFQIATNTDDLTWVFAGPDGTSDTYYEASGPIDLTLTTGRYFRYRAFFYSDGLSTPILQETRLNYSP